MSETLIGEVPGLIPKPPQQTPDVRHVIDSVPSQQELIEGTKYKGERGEFGDVANLMTAFKELDPNQILSDPEKRSEMITSANEAEAAMAIAFVNQKLFGTEGSNVSEEEVVLGRGQGDEYVAGFVGLSPEKRGEVFSNALEVTKKFAAEGQLGKAGQLMANIIVGMQAFKDGNKRTARAIYQLTKYGIDTSKHYDQAVMRQVLGFTPEARNSMYYADRSYVGSFVQEKTEKQNRKAMGMLITYWGGDVVKRTEMADKVSGILDSDLKQKFIKIMQQNGFGPMYACRYGDASGILDAASRGDSEGIKGSLHALLETVDDDKAREIITRDTEEKAKYFNRVIESTAGDKPLWTIYDDDGNPIENNELYRADFSREY